MFLIVQSKVEAPTAFSTTYTFTAQSNFGLCKMLSLPPASPCNFDCDWSLQVTHKIASHTQEQLLKPQAGSFLFCHLSSTGLSNTPRWNSVLSAPISCIRAAASEVCETVQRKRRFGGQATFLWSVSPCCLIAYFVDNRRFIQCNIRGTRGSPLAPDKNAA